MSNLTDKNIFVTGATGLVGAHLVERLLKFKPRQIICLVRSKDPESYFYSQHLDELVVLAYGDLKDKERIFEIMSKYEVNHVFHVAAQPIVPAAYLNPYNTLNVNIIGTVNVLEAARLLPNIESIIVASSDKAYGKVCLKATEEQPLNADHPYDVSKSCADLIARTYFATYHLPVTVSRFGNIYGPGDLNMSRLVPGIMKAIINNEVLEIRSDGLHRRDYIYVKDVVDGYICLAEKITIAQGQAFNFSSQLNFSVLGLIDMVSNILQKKVNYQIVNNQQNEIFEQSLNCAKAGRVLGWQSQSNFENSIKETFSWYEKYFQKK